MKASIDVDIGGTFTDAFIDWGGRHFFTKTPTTGYDLSVGFMRALREGSSLVGVSIGTCEIDRNNTLLYHYRHEHFASEERSKAGSATN